MLLNARRTVALAATLVAAASLAVLAQQPHRKLGYQDTPMLPGGKWHVHDGDRPQPRIVTPGSWSAEKRVITAPSDAVVLFDGTNLDAWRSSKGQDANWDLVDGAMVTKAGTGPLATRQEFGDCQLHVEWSTPTPPKGEDQGRGNSGVLIFGRYEIQVLDSYENLTYPDGQAAAIYGQYPPLVNASRPPGEWQTYDIIFTAPRFKEDGSLETPAYATVLHNGVLVQNHRAIIGPMRYRNTVPYEPHGPKGPLVLQDHGNPIRYRNIWIRELRPEDAS